MSESSMPTLPSAVDESLEDMQNRQKKELRSLEMEHRSNLKKVSKTSGKAKGKKAKELIERTESEYKEKCAIIKVRHIDELKLHQVGLTDATKKVNFSVEEEIAVKATAPAAVKVGVAADGHAANEMDKAARKRAKNLKKRQNKRDAERSRENELAAEAVALQGRSERDVEMGGLQTRNDFAGRGLAIREVGADGHSLYRAVGVGMQLGDGAHLRVRSLCADALAASPEEYGPFAELESDYDAYVDSVRHTSAWGGQLEVRALSEGLKRPVVIFSNDDGVGGALLMGGEFFSGGGGGVGPVDVGQVIEAACGGDGNVILLSYHRHYYALGEHYNAVVRG